MKFLVVTKLKIQVQSCSDVQNRELFRHIPCFIIFFKTKLCMWFTGGVIVGV